VTRSVQRIAVLNRGEPATRCLRAIRELRIEDGSGLVAIALYTDPDASAPYVLEADEALSLGPAVRGPGRRIAYLDQRRIFAALRAVRADAIWPGWGFLAEDGGFVEQVEARGLVFLGPSAATIHRLSDKLAAKRLARACDVATLPASECGEKAELSAFARDIGFPIMLKAAAGGGGRGIRQVRGDAEFSNAFDRASEEARNAFGDPRLFVEACAPRARHIEVQIAADRHGRILPVGLRDCSVQRSHQKIVEEAPPPNLPAATRAELCEASERLMREARYVGVGTVEFLLAEDGTWAFLEINPRLQVEHGLTEMLTGLDLVKWQIRIARGESLPESAPAERGHAIEARVCAEDPGADFAPSPGAIDHLELPAGPGVRVDCGISPSGRVPSEFDSMVAKVIAHGATREEARARLVRAVSDLRGAIVGGMLNKGFLLDVLTHPDFIAAQCDTRWLATSSIAGTPAPRVETLLVAAVLCYQRGRDAVRRAFFAEAARGRPRHIPPSTGREIDLAYAGESYRLRVFAIGDGSYRIYLDERVVHVTLEEPAPGRVILAFGGRRHIVLYSESDADIRIEIEGRTHRVERDLGGQVRAPSPALVIELAVRPGDEVVAGQRLGLLEAMKTETAFFAPIAGVVRETFVRAGERVDAGDVLLVLEPKPEGAQAEAAGEGASRPRLVLETAHDALDALFDPKTGRADLGRASRATARVQVETVRVLRREARRILLGYDVNPHRAERLVAILESPVAGIRDAFQVTLAQVATAIELYVDVERLFNRSPNVDPAGQLGPSNEAQLALYLRRIEVEGVGVDRAFLDALRRALAHYEVTSLAPTPTLYRTLLRLCATRTTLELRNRLITALLNMVVRLTEQGERFQRVVKLEPALRSIAELRGVVPQGVADLASHARYVTFERPPGHAGASPRTADDEVMLAATLVPPPAGTDLEVLAAQVGLSVAEVRRFELWRLASFELERVDTLDGVYTFYGRARDQSGDERLFCFAEATDLGQNAPLAPDMTHFEQRFHEAIEAMRSLHALRDPTHRLHWNRLYVFIRVPMLLSDALLARTVSRLSPETRSLGFERVIVRYAEVDPHDQARPPVLREVLSGNPTGSHVETSRRTPHSFPLLPATAYERNVSRTRVRGLIYPYELIRLFTTGPRWSTRGANPAAPIGPGAFDEHDLGERGLVRVERSPGENTCGVVVGIISTPTEKVKEGMRRVLILSDPTFGLGALAAAECDRIVAAIDLAERERVPVEWVTVSSGARVSLASGTENLDATARVVRRLVTFTDAGGIVNIIAAGVNVGAQSYFDALATMGLQARGILVMLTSASLVLTGRASLEVSGGVSAEDEVAIGGYERIMGPSGQAHIQAGSIGDAYQILMAHYAVSYCPPGEPGPRRFATADASERDITETPYTGDEGFTTIGDVFSAAANAERKRPFAMRPLMRALIDADADPLEPFREWAGAETAIVWLAHLGGFPVTLIGIESRPIARAGLVPNDGPETWTAGTLFPYSSKKIARALNAASGVRPAVVLANLSGFDGSPESMRRGVLELGAEIARAVVRFRGPLLFTVVTRYHGGAYVVFSRELNGNLRATALAGSFASVLGGSAAAAVVFPNEVRRRANDDPRVIAAREALLAAPDSAVRGARRADLERVLLEVHLEKQGQLAAEFDRVHSIERAREVGSIEAILEPARLRPSLIRYLETSGDLQATRAGRG
jgi:acetyl/propionyl-CoA carboxylase alpha subunit/acetyl-CoA carboxylase carboxyltransferase component